MTTESPLSSAAANYADGIAIIDNRVNGRRWSFSQYAADARELSRSLANLGPGCRVGWIDRDPVESLRLLASCFEANLTACPLSPRWPTAACRQAIEIAAIDTFVDRICPDQRTLEVRNLLPAAHVAGERSGETNLATIIFSSGSTGVPKAIGLSMSALLENARGANQNLPLECGDRWLLSLPLYHVGGLGILFRCLLSGATAVCLDQGAAELTHENPHAITHASFVPTQLARLLEGVEPTRPRGLRCVLLGGAPLRPSLCDRASKLGWPICTTYGLTEMSSQVTATALGASGEELRTCGNVLPGRELRIEADGQVAVRGATLMAGYVTAKALRLPLTDDGWFLTGDLGQLDDAGRLLVLGRRDNMFVSGGENIHPEEIELQLLVIPGVRQAIVVPIPDDEFGARPVAIIDAAENDVCVWNQMLESFLPRFKLPDAYYQWEPSERLKPDRSQLRQRVIAGMCRRIG
ncbi:MAG: AMP-binding protein [Planctomycetales bacterium]|nr:AMP-binding protein [Planctomycetales bacterium]